MATITVETPGESIEIEFTLSWDDQRKVEDALLDEARGKAGYGRQRAIVWGAVGGILVIGGALVLWTSRGLAAIAGVVLMLLAPVVGLAGLWWLRRQTRIALARQREGTAVKQNWVADKNGLRCRMGRSVTRLAWSDIRRVRRLQGCFAIFVDDLHCYLIPDRAFISRMQEARFLDMLKRGIGSRPA